jgi:hypothetical protein
VRDHLHTLRSLVPDLDPAGAAADQAPQPQALDHLVAKWRHPPYGVGHTACDVRVGVHLTGAVAAHGRERAAVDGVLTTLIMQAMRWAADGIVYVVLVPHGAGQDVRAVVYHRHAARADLPQDRGRGWTRCAAYVADCYGLPTVQQCLAAQYLAADVIDGYGWLGFTGRWYLQRTHGKVAGAPWPHARDASQGEPCDDRACSYLRRGRCD